MVHYGLCSQAPILAREKSFLQESLHLDRPRTVSFIIRAIFLPVPRESPFFGDAGHAQSSTNFSDLQTVVCSASSCEHTKSKLQRALPVVNNHGLCYGSICLVCIFFGKR